MQAEAWKRLWHRCFPVNFAKFLITPFLTEDLRWLFLNKIAGWRDLRFSCDFCETAFLWNTYKRLLLSLGNPSRLLLTDYYRWKPFFRKPRHWFLLKETRNSYFCVTPKNHPVILFSWNILKSTIKKKVIVCFYNLGEENF